MNGKQQRFSDQLLQDISAIIHKRLNDNRIGFISLTAVELSSDLKRAKVLYSQIGSESEKKHTQKALSRASNFIKFELGKIIKTRSIPNIVFVYDYSLEQGVQLVNKINQLSNMERLPESERVE